MPTLDPPWQAPDWQAQVEQWLAPRLADHSLRLTAPIEQPHVRPWATVLRLPTTGGDLWFKATTPALGHEPALTAALAAWRPDCMVPVLAADPARGWLLMADAGATLRSQVQGAADLHHWHQILPLYAEVQREMASRQPDLLALGTLDRRLAGLPAQFETLLDERAALHIDRPDGLSSAAYHRLRALVPHFAAMCAELASLGLPETLHHDDFHDANIFVRDGRHLFSDWGESCITHPFFTLVVGFRSIAYRLDLAADGPEIASLRDAYLEPWTDLAPLTQLRAAADLAQQIGTVCRALTWHRVISSLPPAIQAEYAEPVPGWLLEFHDLISVMV